MTKEEQLIIEFKKMMEHCYDADLSIIDTLEVIEEINISPPLKHGDDLGIRRSQCRNKIKFTMNTLLNHAIKINNTSAIDKILMYLKLPENLTTKEKISYYQLVNKDV